MVLTTYDSDVDIQRAVEAGAIGYVPTDTPREELSRAIRSAASGTAVLVPEIQQRLMVRVRTPQTKALTGRELDVMRLVASGSTNAEIAQALRVGEATVKSRLVHVFEKPGVPDRTSAVIALLKRGQLNLDEVELPSGEPSV